MEVGRRLISRRPTKSLQIADVSRREDRASIRPDVLLHYLKDMSAFSIQPSCAEERVSAIISIANVGLVLLLESGGMREAA